MDDLIEAIERYAEAYAVLEKLQRERVEHLPRGDQKTGVIAEFYARIYALRRFPGSGLEFGTTSESGWDIKVAEPGGLTTKIQVKAVSGHSETSRVSPINPGWDHLWLMRLDDKLLPEGFWTIRAIDVPWSRQRLAHRTMPRRGITVSGSSELRDGKDEFEDLITALSAASPRYGAVFQRIVRRPY